MFKHRVCGGCAVLWQDRVGHTVGEVTIGLVVHLDELEGQVLLKGIDHQARTAITGVHHDLHGLQGAGIDIAQQVIHIGSHHLKGFIFTLPRSIFEGFRHPVADIVETIVRTDGSGFRSHHLHAVVVPGLWLAVTMMPPSMPKWLVAK